MLLRRTFLGATAAACFAPAVRAASLAKPAGRVVLTVSGKIGEHNTGNAAAFDLAMLDALPQGQFTGETPWTKGQTTFTGPLGSGLLAAVGATGTKMRISALNDYSCDVPVADFSSYRVILATRQDGKTMPVREKGPVWVIYPWDTDASLRSETYYQRCVWQIKTIELL